LSLFENHFSKITERISSELVSRRLKVSVLKTCPFKNFDYFSAKLDFKMTIFPDELFLQAYRPRS